MNLDEWAAMWAPAISLFAADVASTLGDIMFDVDSVTRYFGTVQPRPLVESLAAHTRTAAAVISSCSKSCISSVSFYDGLW